VFGKKWLASCGAVGPAIRREWISEGFMVVGGDVGLYSRTAVFFVLLPATNTPPIEAPPPAPDIRH
jgi:hypothetical protein